MEVTRMLHARAILLCAVIACSGAPTLWARPSSPTQATSATAPAPDLSIQRELIEESNKARAAGDYATARAIVLEVVTYLLARPEPERDAAWLELLDSAASAAWYAQDVRTADTAWKHVLEVRSRTLPEDHPQLQWARANFAITLSAQGDLAAARALEEKVLAFRSATLPDEHPDLQRARMHLAGTLRAQGNLAAARALSEKVLEVQSRTLSDDDPDLQMARRSAAIIRSAQGDLAAARALSEKVVEVQSRTLPDDHPDQQAARTDLANTLFAQGDFAAARALREKVLEVLSRTLADEHPHLQWARANLAITLFTQGDLAAARALEEKVLEVRLATLPDEHPDLQLARGNLAVTLYAHGDLAAARALSEKVLEVQSRTLPDDHPELQAARRSLANTLRAQRDLAAAQALEEQILEASSRTLPDDHPDLQMARTNLAVTLFMQVARGDRATGDRGETTIELEGGRERCVQLIGAMCRAWVDAAHATILSSPGREAEERCASMAQYIDISLSFAQGFGVSEPLRALESESFVCAEMTRGAALTSAQLTRRAVHSPKYGELRDALRAASDEFAALAQRGATSGEFDRARAKRESVERELAALARAFSLKDSSEAELTVESLANQLDAGEVAVAFRRYTKWRMDVVDELDSTGQPKVRESPTDSLCAFVVHSSKASSNADANRGAHGAASGAQPDDARRSAAPSSALALVDLGPMAPIDDAARSLREGLGVASAGRGVPAGAREKTPSNLHGSGVSLRERIFDPLLPTLAGATRIVVVPDDVLHLVPFDALPLDEEMLVGDRFEIQMRTTLSELLLSHEPFEEQGALVAFGDVDYRSAGVALERGEPMSSDATAVTRFDPQPRAPEHAAPAAEAPANADGGAIEPSEVTQHPRERASILRGSFWDRGFAALPGTGLEVRGITRSFADQFGGAAAIELCEGATATRERLLQLAPQARWLHIATHGWFAAESIRSWSDSEPLDQQTGLGSRLSGEAQVKGMSPMLLCGLALAGASLPEDAVGRAPGLITADELSTLDLSNCELAVLSACDTNVGERRAGQGVASLQKALQMAGARSVITSLWKVPDEATKELMLDFYRRLWVAKRPKWQALWEAKKTLRDAKDERGEPKYTTRDWAAWVLTGDPG
jgi:CHAT domain-containing protein